MNRHIGPALAALLLFAAVPVSAAPSAAIQAAVSDPGRPAGDVAADAARKPAEMLDFAGVKPGDKIAELDALNPQVASRLLGAFSRWKRLEPVRQAQAQSVLQSLAGRALSNDTSETLGRLLGS